MLVKQFRQSECNSNIMVYPLKFDFGKNSRSQKLSTAKKNPPIWKKIVKFGSREKKHLYGSQRVDTE